MDGIVGVDRDLRPNLVEGACLGDTVAEMRLKLDAAGADQLVELTVDLARVVLSMLNG